MSYLVCHILFVKVASFIPTWDLTKILDSFVEESFWLILNKIFLREF